MPEELPVPLDQALLPLFAEFRRGVLTTLKRDGRPQQSVVAHAFDPAEATLRTPQGRAVRLVGCYHVSPHNTYTGRLTPQMLDAVLLSLRS